MKFPIVLALLAFTSLTSNAELIRRSKGDFILKSTIAGKRVVQDVYYCAPRRIKSDTRVVIVMHGNQRTAEGYRDAWERHAEEEGLIVLVPEFTERSFPGSNAYNLAGMISPSRSFTPRSQWAFPLIDNLFLAVKEDQGLESERFYLYGHSAGAQFVHRYTMFANSPRLGLAIAANAGWYTFPTMVEVFPYGIAGLAEPFDAKSAFSASLIILLGSEDTDPDHKDLRKTKEALRQGKHRFERGKNYYEAATEAAREQGFELNWKQRIVPGVGHSNQGMSDSAVEIIQDTDI